MNAAGMPISATSRPVKPPPAGPPPTPPNITSQSHAGGISNTGSSNKLVGGGSNINGSHQQTGKKKADTPIDPVTMYESLKNRIAALEEDEQIEEEEERRYGDVHFALG